MCAYISFVHNETIIIFPYLIHILCENFESFKLYLTKSFFLNII